MEKKAHFLFGKKCKIAILVINKSRSNLFFTLLDVIGQPIITKTMSSPKISNNKRKKLATQSISIIINQFKSFFYLYNIEAIYLVLKIRINKYVWTFFHKFKLLKLKIAGVFIQSEIPHNGMRVRKKRRK